MYRRILITLAVLTTTVATSLTFSSPAMASGSRPASCNTASLCFYNNANFGDGPGKVTGRNNDLGAFSHASCPNDTWSNCMSSVWNATSKCFHLYDATGAAGGVGTYHNLGPNDGYLNLGTEAAYNDKVSSVKPNPSGSGSCSFS
jgi:hypothetical protein